MNRIQFRCWLLVGLVAMAAACSQTTTNDSANSESTEENAVAVNTQPAPSTEAPTETIEPEPTTPTLEPIESPTEAPTATAETTNEEPALPENELAEAYAEYQLITLLPPDAIPSIDDPQFLSITEADQFYDPHEFIIGVSIDGDSRAYSIPLLSNHEIVNDRVAGRKIAVTW